MSTASYIKLKRTIMEQTLAEQSSIKKNSFSYNFVLFLATVLVLGIIIWLKTNNFIAFTGDEVLIFYTAFLTFFQTVRILGALFYKYSFNALVNAIPRYIARTPYEPMISFVVPCKNEENAIRQTVETCLSSHYPKEKMEVIVINDGSTDRTGEILTQIQNERPEDNLIVVNWTQNRGKRHGMMEGFTRSRGEIIIQLDSDSYIYPDKIRDLIDPFRNPEIGAVCAHADPENANENFITKMQAAYYFMSFRILKAAESTFGVVFCCSGCSSAYRRDAVMPILDEWLNESFMGAPVTWGDDRSLTAWVIKGNYKTIYTDKARAVTIVPNNIRQLLVQQVRWKKSWIINSFFTGRFIWKKEPFVAFLYYYPLVAISLLTPFMAARAIFYTPFNNPESTLFYIIGGVCITALLVLIYRFVARENKYWPYLFAWTVLNIFVLSYLMIYAALTLQNRSWGTR